jgi:hypothetical protein
MQDLTSAVDENRTLHWPDRSRSAAHAGQIVSQDVEQRRGGIDIHLMCRAMT